MSIYFILNVKSIKFKNKSLVDDRSNIRFKYLLKDLFNG